VDWKWLQLSWLPEINLWKGPTRHVSLQSLVLLDLNSLDKLTFISTSSLTQSLPKLETFDISNCGELKHIIREEDGEREIILESPGFPSSSLIICFNSPQLLTSRVSSFGRLWVRAGVKINVSLSREFKSRRTRLWRLTCLVGPFHIQNFFPDQVERLQDQCWRLTTPSGGIGCQMMII